MQPEKTTSERSGKPKTAIVGPANILRQARTHPVKAYCEVKHQKTEDAIVSLLTDEEN
jgi:hypothetical protein